MSQNQELARYPWSTAPLGAICDIAIGRTPSRNQPEYWGGEHPWLSIADMNQGPLVYSTKERITSKGVSESGSRLVRRGTVLLSFKLSIGKVAVAGIDTYTNEAIAALPIVDTAKVDRDFLSWALRSIRLDEEVDAAAKGKTLNKAKLERLRIPLPPLDEQRRIAAILEMADAVRRERRESLQLTEDLLHSVFIEMFGTATAPACPRVALSSHLAFVTSGGRGWAKYYTTDGAKFIRSLDVQMNEINDSQMIRVTPPVGAEANRTRVRVGDVLLTITGSLIGRAAPVTDAHAGGYVSQHVAILRTQGFQPEFLSWALSTQEGQQQIQKHQTGQTKPGLNFEQIGRLTIPRPSAEKEDTFCKLIRARRLIVTEQRDSLQQAHDLFASLQQRAFSGKLDLSRLVLDEPMKTIARSGQPGPEPKTVPNGRRVLAFAVPQAIETTLKKLDDDLKKNEMIPWSAAYFKYRILGVQPVPFTFEDVMQRAAGVFEEAPYEEIKDILFDLLGKGGRPAPLRQSFELEADGGDQGEGRRGIVFVPAV